MVAVPAVLFYFTLFVLALFAILGAIAIIFAIALLFGLYRLVRMAQNGVDAAREKLTYVHDLFISLSSL